MKKLIERIEGARLLSKTEQKDANGAGPVAICLDNGDCPPGTTCIGNLCFTDNNPGGGGGTGCNEPLRFCFPPETGCGCVY